MKLFTKVFVTVMLLLLMTVPCIALAEDARMDSVSMYFEITQIPTMIECDAVFNLYDESGQTLLGTHTQSIKRGDRWFDFTIDVEPYPIGTKFRLVLFSGEKEIYFNGAYGREHIVETYAYPDENGVDKYQTSFYMTYTPAWNKEASIKIPGTGKTLFYHCLTEDEVYVTLDLLNELDIRYTLDMSSEKPSATLFSEDGLYVAQFFLNDIYATFGGQGENLNIPTFEIGGWPYFPLSKIAQYFACSYTAIKDDEYVREIALTASQYSESFKKAKYVNSQDITSRTDYLIWVSKKDYTVNVYKGSDKNWRLVKSSPCAIGAPATPTIEGSFEYHQYQTRWTYDNYYCGPIMRFYKGYALHSTLIRYNGTPYDNRVGVKISHGCVRMRPEDINWLAKNIPLYTRVLVTA